MSCVPLDKAIKDSYRSELYIDYKMVEFSGKNSTQSITFAIDSTRSKKYFGKIIINKSDTFQINGFEKGSHYPSWYTDKETGENSMIDIWCSVRTAQIPDSLEIYEHDTVNRLIDEKTVLYRVPRTRCD